MKAAVLRELGKPLQLEEVETPVPGPDEALVKIMACGTDGTDLKLMDGFGYTPDLPIIMGHEPAGVVAEVGNRVTELKTGNRVVTHNFTTCGVCTLCRTQRENICPNMTGVLGARGRNGGFAEYLTIPARQLVQVPENVPWPDAAVCCDAGITAFHAVDRARVKLGETVVVIGIGGVGSVVTQLAKAAGACVVAIDRSERKEQWASDMGADEVLDSSKVEIPDAVRKLTDDSGADCVIDVVGTEETMTCGFESLRNGGRLVIVGYTPEHYPVSGKRLAQNELEIIGSRCGRVQDLVNTVRLVAEGKIKSIVTDLFPLEEANGAMASLRAGKVLGRTVLLTEAGRQAT